MCWFFTPQHDKNGNCSSWENVGPEMQEDGTFDVDI